MDSPTPLRLDADLIRRYDASGPRYTSYPTAVQFHEGFRTAEYLAAARRANRAGAQPLSIYVHVPFCRSPCFYCGCNKIVTSRLEYAAHYLKRLHREIELQSPLHSKRRAVQLHLGGGTPTFLDDGQLAALLASLRAHFAFAPAGELEASIELDPRTCDAARLRLLADLGFNRISLGVQDFDPAVQAAVNRAQSVDSVRALVVTARELELRSISFDLIYGLPRQNRQSFARTLETVLELRPDRLALYSYAHLPSLFKAQRQILARDLPDAETKLQLMLDSIRALRSAGYEYIGMDHFALPGDELVLAQRSGQLQRNFQGYSTGADCDLVGLGVSSISKIGDIYAQHEKTLPKYYAAIDAGEIPVARGLRLGPDDLIRRHVIQELMCRYRIDPEELDRRFGIESRRYFAEEFAALAPFENDGLLLRAANAWQVTETGRLLLRNIAMTFDAYLRKPVLKAANYSRTI